MDINLAHVSTDGTPHLLREHLLAVAAAAHGFAEPFGSETWAHPAGLRHGLGKYRPGFQRHSRQPSPKGNAARGIGHHLATGFGGNLMDRRDLIIVMAGGVSFTLSSSAWAMLSQADAASGIRLALERGAGAAVDLLGRRDGFLGNPKVRIPLPGHLEDAAGLLKATGQGEKVEELVTAMNRAAEAAVPEARDMLVTAAKGISAQDALKIVRGNSTAVTEYFASKTRAPLEVKFLPIVTRATEKVSLAESYNSVAGKAVGFGLIKKKDANIQQYVTRRALNGLFVMIGEEEKKIRADPVKTGSDLLQRVFGG